MAESQRILITGGAGFIGSHVVDAFVADGHEVAVVDDLSSGRRENLEAKVPLHVLDIGDGAVAEVFRAFQPQVLVHLAAQIDVRRSVTDPAFDAQVNIVSSLRLLELCREYGTHQVIFSSTGGAIYGEQDYFPADEKHPARPVSPYGAAKLAVESYLHYYAQIYGMKTVALRYANVYGPRQNPHGEAGVVAIFCSQLLSGKQPTIFGDGKQTRDFVYVGDVVRANQLALEHGLVGAYNVGTGVETSVVQLYDLIREALEGNEKAVFAPAKTGEQQRSCIAVEKLQAATGWMPQVDLPVGLKKTAQFFIGQMDRG